MCLIKDLTYLQILVNPAFYRKSKETSAEGKSPPQELEAGLSREPYHLLNQYQAMAKLSSFLFLCV